MADAVCPVACGADAVDRSPKELRVLIELLQKSVPFFNQVRH